MGSQRRSYGCWMGASSLVAILMLPGSLQAGFSDTVLGISIKYSLTGATAEVLPSGLLVVTISESGGSLKVAATPEAPSIWGDFCPVVVLASGQSLKSISTKGFPWFPLLVIGECRYVQKFTGSFTNIGGLLSIGGELVDPEIGFYKDADTALPSQLTLKSGVAWGVFCGIEWDVASQAPAVEVPSNGTDPEMPHVANAGLRALLEASTLEDSAIEAEGAIDHSGATLLVSHVTCEGSQQPSFGASSSRPHRPRSW